MLPPPTHLNAPPASATDVTSLDSDLSDDDEILSDDDSILSSDSELASPASPSDLAENENFGFEYEGPRLSNEDASRLITLMLHASTCPCQ